MGISTSFCPEVFYSLLYVAGSYSLSNGTNAGIFIQGAEYSTIRRIGEGGQAYIYEGIDVSTGNRVALKRYVVMDHTQLQVAMEGINIYRSISPNEHIVTYISSDTLQDDGAQLPELWMVMELCSGPSLQDFINNAIHSNQPFRLQEVYQIIDSAVRAIAHMHSQSPPVAHWDIKPENFLFSESGRLKLCDFGSASRKFYQVKNLSNVGDAESELDDRMTLLYRSPESLDLWSKQRVDVKADVWALGVMIYVLVFRDMPFEANPVEIMDGVPNRYRDIQLPVVGEFEPLMRVVLSMMLVKNPVERSDIFTISEELHSITQMPPVSRPKLGLQSAQLPRFT